MEGKESLVPLSNEICEARLIQEASGEETSKAGEGDEVVVNRAGVDSEVSTGSCDDCLADNSSSHLTDVSTSLQCNQVTHSLHQPSSYQQTHTETTSNSIDSVTSTCFEPKPESSCTSFLRIKSLHQLAKFSSSDEEVHSEPTGSGDGVTSGNHRSSSLNYQLIQSDQINSTETTRENVPKREKKLRRRTKNGVNSSQPSLFDQRNEIYPNCYTEQNVLDIDRKVDLEEISLSQTCRATKSGLVFTKDPSQLVNTSKNSHLEGSGLQRNLKSKERYPHRYDKTGKLRSGLKPLRSSGARLQAWCKAQRELRLKNEAGLVSSVAEEISPDIQESVNSLETDPARINMPSVEQNLRELNVLDIRPDVHLKESSLRDKCKDSGASGLVSGEGSSQLDNKDQFSNKTHLEDISLPRKLTTQERYPHRYNKKGKLKQCYKPLKRRARGLLEWNRAQRELRMRIKAGLVSNVPDQVSAVIHESVNPSGNCTEMHCTASNGSQKRPRKTVSRTTDQTRGVKAKPPSQRSLKPSYYQKNRPRRESFQRAVSTIKTYLTNDGVRNPTSKSKASRSSSVCEISGSDNIDKDDSSSNTDNESVKHMQGRRNLRSNASLVYQRKKKYSKLDAASLIEKSYKKTLQDLTQKRLYNLMAGSFVNKAGLTSSLSAETPKTFLLSFSTPNTFNNLENDLESGKKSNGEPNPALSAGDLEVNLDETSKEEELSEFLLFPKRECSVPSLPSELSLSPVSTCESIPQNSNFDDAAQNSYVNDNIAQNVDVDDGTVLESSYINTIDNVSNAVLSNSNVKDASPSCSGPPKRVLDGRVSINKMGFQNMKVNIKRYRILANNISKVGIKNILNDLVNNDKGSQVSVRSRLVNKFSIKSGTAGPSIANLESQTPIRTYSRKLSDKPASQLGLTEMSQLTYMDEDGTTGNIVLDDPHSSNLNYDSSDDEPQFLYETENEKHPEALSENKLLELMDEGSMVCLAGDSEECISLSCDCVGPSDGTTTVQISPVHLTVEPQPSPGHLPGPSQLHPPLSNSFESSGKKVVLECTEEALSETQKDYYDKRKKEFMEFQRRFDLISRRPDVTVEKGETCTFLEYFSAANPLLTTMSTPMVTSTTLTTQNGRIIPGHPSAGLVLLNNPTSGGPARVGLLVPSSTAGLPPQIVSSPLPISAGTVIPGLSVASTRTPATTRTVLSKAGSSATTNLVDAKGNAVKFVVRPKKRKLPESSPAPPTAEPEPTQAPAAVQRPKPIFKPRPLHTLMVDLTDDKNSPIKVDIGAHLPVTCEASAKTYPSLVVMAKACLRTPTDSDKENYKNLREELDGRMKKVLTLSTNNFTEWLIQTGLLRNEIYCAIHKLRKDHEVKLKLGKYTDSNKFPFSGGYVWISDCCPQINISVFAGSIFEGSSFHPSINMKLIYHWACQTSIQNVMQWVTVSSINMKNLFTNLRAICTAAIHEHFGMMGGFGKNIQVAVISLGINKESGVRRTRVEVLSVYDPETKYIRMRAIEPTSELETSSKKFWKIFDIIPSWVDKESTILVDNTVDTIPLHSMGFKSISVTSKVDSNGQEQFPNHELMTYLCPIIRTMFQKTLAILSRVVLQQFLDELVWRERWGYHAALAFDNIVQHLIEQTKIDSGGSLLNRLSKISANPFKDWRYSEWSTNASTKPLMNVVPINRATIPCPSTLLTPSKVAKVLAPIKLPASANPIAPIQPLPVTVNQHIPFPPSQEVSATLTQNDKDPLGFLNDDQDFISNLILFLGTLSKVNRKNSTGHQKALQIFKSLGVIPSREDKLICPGCGQYMSTSEDRSVFLGYRFNCLACLKYIDSSCGTIFDKIRINEIHADLILLIILFFVNGDSQANSSLKSKAPRRLVGITFSVCREVASSTAWRHFQQLGGAGDIVEVAKTCICRRPNIDVSERDCWMLSGFSRTSEKVVGVVLADLGDDTLISEMVKHIHPESWIVSETKNYNYCKNYFRGHSSVTNSKRIEPPKRFEPLWRPEGIFNRYPPESSDPLWFSKGFFNPNCEDKTFHGSPPQSTSTTVEQLVPVRWHIDNMVTTLKELKSILNSYRGTSLDGCSSFIGEWMWRRNVLPPEASLKTRFIMFMRSIGSVFPGPLREQ